MTDSVPKLLPIKQAAKALGLPEFCLRRMVKEGKAPHIMTGNKALVNVTLLSQQLNNL